MADLETGTSEASRKHIRRRRRRLGIRIDMTPMVDVAFLLLTFFMLTTVFSRPQTMEVALPEDNAKIQVAETNVLTLRVLPNGVIYWNRGATRPQRIGLDAVRPLLLNETQANPSVVTVVKIDRAGTYQQAVDILDELSLADVSRFTLAQLTEEDRKLLGL